MREKSEDICGREGHETPKGTFKTSDYYEWRKMVDGTYGRYAVRFNGKILFHSVPYTEEATNTLEWEEYNKLGQSASLGCVRMSVEDAKWIFDNCKPDAIKIDENSPYRMWDPTDINSPWITEQGDYIPFTGTIDEFDYVAYSDRYPDLNSAFGYDKEALYKHYITFGMYERRIVGAIS